MNINFVNKGSDDALLKSLQGQNNIDQEDLSKAIDKSKLVQVERQVQGKTKMFTRKQWVNAGDVKSTDKVIGGNQKTSEPKSIDKQIRVLESQLSDKNAEYSLAQVGSEKYEKGVREKSEIRRKIEKLKSEKSSVKENKPEDILTSKTSTQEDRAYALSSLMGSGYSVTPGKTVVASVDAGGKYESEVKITPKIGGYFDTEFINSEGKSRKETYDGVSALKTATDKFLKEERESNDTKSTGRFTPKSFGFKAGGQDTADLVNKIDELIGVKSHTNGAAGNGTLTLENGETVGFQDDYSYSTGKSNGIKLTWNGKQYYNQEGAEQLAKDMGVKSSDSTNAKTNDTPKSKSKADGKANYFKADASTKSKVADMSKEMGNDKLLQYAKDNGVTWKENDHKGVNIMRMKMALAQAIQEGTIDLNKPDSKPTSKDDDTNSKDVSKSSVIKRDNADLELVPSSWGNMVEETKTDKYGKTYSFPEAKVPLNKDFNQYNNKSMVISEVEKQGLFKPSNFFKTGKTGDTFSLDTDNSEITITSPDGDSKVYKYTITGKGVNGVKAHKSYDGKPYSQGDKIRVSHVGVGYKGQHDARFDDVEYKFTKKSK